MSRSSHSSIAGKLFVFLILVVGLFSLAVPLPGQVETTRDKTRLEQAQKPLQYEISVTLKLIQVFVADAKGEPAPDLEKSDFILYDNGKIQTITEFEKHFIQTPEAIGPDALPQPGLPAAPLLQRKYVFLFDNEGNDLEGMMKSRKAALEFLDRQVLPGDEIAVFSNSPVTGLTLLIYFTSDHQKIRDIFTKTKDSPGREQGGIAMDSLSEHELASPERVFDSKAISVMRGTGMGSGRKGLRPYALRDFLLRMLDLSKALRRVDGQKNVVLFSQGFGSIVASPRLEGQLFRSMAKELASANCPVFAIYTVSGMAKMGPPNEDLSWLSNMTGGKYYDNSDNYTANAQSIQNVTGNYYVLGYSIGSAWDGKFHDIKVEVKRKGYRTYGQKGYFNPVPFNKLSRMEKSLQLIDIALGEDSSHGRSVDFPLAALPFSDRKGNNTILISLIPIKTILGGVGKKTEVISLVFDVNRSVVSGRRAELDWSSFSGENLCQYSVAALAPGRYEARVVVRNLETGKAAVGACPVEVPERTASALKVFPPLFLAAAGATQYANFSTDEKDKAGQVFSLSQAFLFSTRHFSPAIGRLEEASESFRAVLRCEWTDSGEAPDLQVRAWLEVPGSGQKVPIEVSLDGREKRGEIIFLYLQFIVPGLKAGSYELHIQAEEPVTKTKAETKIDLRLR